MKTRIFFLIIVLCFLLPGAKAQDNSIYFPYPWIPISKLIRGGDTIMYGLKDHSLYKGVPNEMLIIIRPKRHLKIISKNGVVSQVKDSLFEIVPTVVGNYEIQINELFSSGRINRLPDLSYLYLAGYPYPQPVTNTSSLIRDITLENLYKYNRIEGRFRDYVYKIKGFQCRITDINSKSILECPVFRSDTISYDFLNSVKVDNPAGLRLEITNVTYETPDTSEGTRNVPKINFFLSQIYKDSTDMLVGRYFTGTSRFKLTRSNVRIKIEGNPTGEDIQTIQKITGELNSLLRTVKVKIVKRFPSLVIRFDTQNPGLRKSAPSGITRKIHPFFPLIYDTRLIVSSGINQHERDLILWREISRSLGSFSTRYNYSLGSTLIGKNVLPGLTSEDKLVLKSLFIRGGERTLKKIHSTDRIPVYYRMTDNLPNTFILLTILASIILFFIIYEIYNYFNLSSLMRFKFLKAIIGVIFTAQAAILFLYVFKPAQNLNLDPLNFLGSAPKTDFKKIEIFASVFAVAAGLFFLVSDTILKRIKAGWLSLGLNPVLTIISLYLSYQVIYLFVRGEILRFMTIDVNALTIGLSIVAVRFYMQYEQVKITSLMQEKEHELTRQKELKNRAELNALQARINPHFLYNALNSIASLAHIDSGRTENMALSLSRLFRYTINRDQEMTSTVGQEIEMTELYLQIEKHRFADRLDYSISVEENLRELVVPRLLIQPLVENAIKHGISGITGQGMVKVMVYQRDRDLFIEIYDNGPAFPDGLISGYGLQNTYDKLMLVYKKPYEVRFVNSPEKFIQIKLKNI